MPKPNNFYQDDDRLPTIAQFRGNPTLVLATSTWPVFIESSGKIAYTLTPEIMRFSKADPSDILGAPVDATELTDEIINKLAFDALAYVTLNRVEGIPLDPPIVMQGCTLGNLASRYA